MIAPAMASQILEALLADGTFKRPVGDVCVALFIEEPLPDFSNTYTLHVLGLDPSAIAFAEVEPGVYANSAPVLFETLGNDPVTFTHFGVLVNVPGVSNHPLIAAPFDTPVAYPGGEEPGVISTGAIRVPLGPLLGQP